MPEAAVEEHSHSRAREDYVCSATERIKRREIDTIAIAVAMEFATDRKLEGGVPGSIRPH